MGGKKSSDNKYFLYGSLIIIIAVAAYALIPRNSGPGKFDDLAKCLSEKGTVMYGTEWCPHCKEQKKMFGSSFQYVNYVDCDRQRETCLREGVKGYPTWKFADGSTAEGTTSLYTLSQRSGCTLSS
ncbi:hypothetical protein D6764_00055 [Candidatus Woesearchaeota archaeon]|nr:MAG: hypothetical protein D6764_00055 [Candidatus Woesearchaeota archaeon]